MEINDFYNLLVKYHKENHKFPEYPWMMKESGLSRDKVRDYLRELQGQGKIYRNHSEYKVEPVKRKETVQATKKPEKTVLVDKITIMRIASVIIGSLAIVIEIWYQSIGGGVKELLQAVILIGFSNIIFEAAIIFWLQKSFHLLSFVFGFLFLIVLSINILLIIGGQVNHYQSKLESIAIDNQQFYELELLKKDEKELSDQLYLLEKRLNTYVETGVDNWKFYELQKTIKTTREQLSKARAQMKDKLGSTHQKTDTMTAVSKAIGIKREVIEFFFQILPALFLGIISAVCFALAIFLKKEDK